MKAPDQLLTAKTFTICKYFDEDDLAEDLTRIRHVKKLISRMKSGKPNYRLIINHMIILFNVFEAHYVIHLLKSSFKETDWIFVNTILVFLRRSLDVVNVDHTLLSELKRTI